MEIVIGEIDPLTDNELYNKSKNSSQAQTDKKEYKEY